MLLPPPVQHPLSPESIERNAAINNNLGAGGAAVLQSLKLTSFLQIYFNVLSGIERCHSVTVFPNDRVKY